MDKCPTVELGVQDTHLSEKKKKILSRVSIRDTLTNVRDESIRTIVEASDSTPPSRTKGHRRP